MPTYDLLVYHDFTDTLNDRLASGDDAGEKLGDKFEGMRVVAIGSPVHEGRDATVILAHSNRPMDALQAYADRGPTETAKDVTPADE